MPLLWLYRDHPLVGVLLAFLPGGHLLPLHRDLHRRSRGISMSRWRRECSVLTPAEVKSDDPNDDQHQRRNLHSVERFLQPQDSHSGDQGRAKPDQTA